MFQARQTTHAPSHRYRNQNPEEAFPAMRATHQRGSERLEPVTLAYKKIEKPDIARQIPRAFVGVIGVAK